MEQTTVVASGQPAVCVPTFGHSIWRPAESEGLDVTCDEREVPTIAGAELERLYQSPYATLVKFGIDGTLANAGTYIVQQGGQLKTLFLFLIEKGRLEVLNEVIRVDAAEAQHFANTIFAKFSQVDVILFRSIHTDIRTLSFPFQRFNHSEDIVLALPDSEQEYLARLGPSTRKSIKQYYSRLQRSYPSLIYQIYDGETVTEQQIRTIIALNRARMAGKNKVSGIGEEETQSILGLVKAYGVVVVATIEGQICAGSICYRIGSHYFMSVCAHDPAYDSYRLGTQCAYRTICECIGSGGREFHFLWGDMEYKYRLLGTKRELDHVAIYRSRSHMLQHAGTVLQIASRGYLRRLKLWLHRYNGQLPWINRLMLRTAGAVRSWIQK